VGQIADRATSAAADKRAFAKLMRLRGAPVEREFALRSREHATLRRAQAEVARRPRDRPAPGSRVTRSSFGRETDDRPPHGSGPGGALQPLLPRRARRPARMGVGRGGIAGDGSVPHETVEQFRVALANIDACLRAAGAGTRHVVKVTIFMTDISERGAINPLRIDYFGEHRPASTRVEVRKLVDPRLTVEIEAIAFIDGWIRRGARPAKAPEGGLRTSGTPTALYCVVRISFEVS
jgi:enamine deaminase RidA (YjgF/YER057c/UK114 family)